MSIMREFTKKSQETIFWACAMMTEFRHDNREKRLFSDTLAINVEKESRIHHTIAQNSHNSKVISRRS